MENNCYDVIIVGGGPAGSITALCIARKGYRVLLIDKSDFPRDKSCGDGLTRTASRLLHELGLHENFKDYQKIGGVRVLVQDEGERNFNYPGYLADPAYGLVVPRIQLDHILHQRALEAGAEFKARSAFSKLLYDTAGRQVTGIRIATGEEFFADVVIGADGAASKIAYQASLASTPRNKLGFGIRGYFENIQGLTDKLEIHLPILDSSNKYVLPSYGWVFPMGDGKANIGVGLIEKTETDNIQSVMDMFVEKLKRTDSRFETMTAKGKLFGAPMRFDFKPGNTFAPGLMLAGDAAGMISPFTGEGIGYAIETGVLASEIYIEEKRYGRNFSDLSGYGRLLASRYQGYFETGNTSVNRYQLVWKILKGTFQNDKPLFSAIRQSAVFPEGIGENFAEHYFDDVSAHIRYNRNLLKTDLLAVNENLINLTRQDWPFLSRMFSAAQTSSGIAFRPSLFLLLSGYSEVSDRDKLVRLATSLELGFIASICHDSVIESRNDSARSSFNWGNMISILVGDFLLSKSFEIITAMESIYAKIISEAIAAANTGLILMKRKLQQAPALSVAEYIEISYKKNSNTFELCMHLGSVARKTKVSETNALIAFGRHFGAAYFLIEDTHNYLKRNDGQDANSYAISYPGNPEISLMHVLLAGSDHSEVVINEQIAAQRCFQYAAAEIQKALFQINTLDNPELKEMLINLCKFISLKAAKDV